MSKRSPMQVKTVRGFRRVVKLVPVKRTIIKAGPVYVAFGKAIRAARRQRNLTQADLAASLRLSRASIANIETGRQRVMLDDLFIFSQALDISPRKLFDAVKP